MSINQGTLEIKTVERKWGESLARIAARLNAQLEMGTILKTVCEETALALDVPAASIGLYDEARDLLYRAEAVGLPSEFAQANRLMPRELYDDYARQTTPLIIIKNIQAVPQLPDAERYAALNICSVAMTGMMRDGKLIGLLNVFSMGVERQFGDDELALLKAIANQAAQAISNAGLFAQANRRLAHVEALHTIDIAITASLDVRLTLNIFLEQLMAQLRVDAADVLQLNTETQLLEYTVGRGFRTRALQHTKLHIGEGHAGQVALERRMLNIPNLNQTAIHLARAPMLASEEFVCYYALPLIAKGQVKGVLEIFHRSPLEPDAEWLTFLEALSRQAAIAIDNAVLFDRLQKSNTELTLAYDAMIEGLSRALDARSHEPEGHTIQVTETALALGRALDMNADELAHLRRGALLHDIGEMAISDSILRKPGPLDDSEWEIMRQHPVYAYRMLSPITPLRAALDVPYNHHEWWDGTGYPRGLKGEQIPWAARVFAVVDVWDALRSERPFRAAWREPRVREFLRTGAGTHFDPKVTETFLAMQPPYSA